MVKRMSKIKVFTNGCFDLFHCGHLHVLKEAKKLGTELHVGINSDISVSKLKGSNRPIIPEGQRGDILLALKCVDYIYFFDDETPLKLIKYLKPDIIVKGGDYRPEDVVGSHLAKVITIPLIDGVSTTKILERIYDDIQTNNI